MLDRDPSISSSRRAAALDERRRLHVVAGHLDRAGSISRLMGR